MGLYPTLGEISTQEGRADARAGAAGGTVAVKIVSHDGDVGHRMDVLRESLLSANIQHPNVVSTYKARATTSHFRV